MNAVSPVYNEATTKFEQVYALDQPQYTPLVVLRIKSERFQCFGVFSRWELTDEERAAIADGAHLVLSVLSPGNVPPVCLQVVSKDKAPSVEHLE